MELFWQITHTLASLSEHDLEGLANGIAVAPRQVEGLAVWIRHAVDWERDRRAGQHYPLRSPESVLKDDEIGLALVTLSVLTEAFRDNRDADSATVAAFLDS